MLDLLQFNTICDGSQCPVAEQCPSVSQAGSNCKLEEEFMAIAKEWAKTLPESPVTKLRIHFLLQPLFEQYFHLKLAQAASGKPIKDLKYLIRSIALVLNSIKSAERLTS